MPLAYKIKQTMIAQGVSDEILAQFHFPSPKETKPEHLIAITNQMDKLLSKEQCLSIMEQQGCMKTGKMATAARAFGREHAKKTLEEKIKLFAESDIPYKVPPKLNPDGTLTAIFLEEPNGKCACVEVKKLKREPSDVSLTYCGCCGGHLREAYILAFGINLRIKDIVTSHLCSKGQKRCEFLFEMIGK